MLALIHIVSSSFLADFEDADECDERHTNQDHKGNDASYNVDGCQYIWLEWGNR